MGDPMYRAGLPPDRFDFRPATAVSLSRQERRERERAFAKALVKENRVPLGEALALVRQAHREIEADLIFKSSFYQVSIRTADGLHISIRRLDRAPIFERDDLIEIGCRFVPASAIAVELYTADSRVVDTANQYHLFAVPRVLRDEGADMALDLVEVSRRAALAADRQLRGDDWAVWWRDGQGRRDWRALMDCKREWIGAQGEAIDLLLPETRGSGPCWFAVTTPGFQMPFGFAAGARSDRETWNTRQRPGAGVR